MIDHTKKNNLTIYPHTKMKTLITTFALALTLSAASLTASANDDKVKAAPAAPAAYKVAMFPSTSAPRLNVIVEKATGGRVELRLKDAKGHVLHTSYLQKKDGKVWSKFDLSELTDGKYSVEVTNGAETTVKEITLSTQPVAANRVTIVN